MAHTKSSAVFQEICSCLNSILNIAANLVACNSCTLTQRFNPCTNRLIRRIHRNKRKRLRSKHLIDFPQITIICLNSVSQMINFNGMADLFKGILLNIQTRYIINFAVPEPQKRNNTAACPHIESLVPCLNFCKMGKYNCISSKGVVR